MKVRTKNPGSALFSGSIPKHQRVLSSTEFHGRLFGGFRPMLLTNRQTRMSQQSRSWNQIHSIWIIWICTKFHTHVNICLKTCLIVSWRFTKTPAFVLHVSSPVKCSSLESLSHSNCTWWICSYQTVPDCHYFPQSTVSMWKHWHAVMWETLPHITNTHRHSHCTDKMPRPCSCKWSRSLRFWETI